MTLDKRSIRTEAVDDATVQLSRDGALVDDSNPVPVEIVEGGASPQAEQLDSASIAPQASATLQAALIPAATTGRFQKIVVASEGAWQAVVRTDDGVTQTPLAVLHGEAGATVEWSPRNARAALYNLAGDGVGTRFDVVVTNNEPNIPTADSHVISATLEWDEI